MLGIRLQLSTISLGVDLVPKLPLILSIVDVKNFQGPSPRWNLLILMSLLCQSVIRISFSALLIQSLQHAALLLLVARPLPRFLLKCGSHLGGIAVEMDVGTAVGEDVGCCVGVLDGAGVAAKAHSELMH